MGLLDHVKIENLDEDQRKMVELVGLDGFKSLVRAFGGTTIYIPKAESLERAARDQKIREEFDAIHVHQTEISRYDKAPGKSGKNLTEEIIESLPRNMDLPSAG